MTSIKADLDIILLASLTLLDGDGGSGNPTVSFFMS